MARTVWKASLWALVLISLWLSLVPAEHVPSAFNFWDKAQHALGFAGLALLGLMAYPGRVRVLLPGLWRYLAFALRSLSGSLAGGTAIGRIGLLTVWVWCWAISLGGLQLLALSGGRCD